MSEKPKWYVAHTYSGYEKKVKDSIEKIIENRNMQDQILEVVVPMEEYTKEVNGKEEKFSRKIFPGYVLLNMFMNDDTWYVVRNTRGVTSFVGPGSKPVPLTEQEIASMGVVGKKESIDIQIGDAVLFETGLFTGISGIVTDINNKKRILSVKCSNENSTFSYEAKFEEVSKI